MLRVNNAVAASTLHGLDPLNAAYSLAAMTDSPPAPSHPSTTLKLAVRKGGFTLRAKGLPEAWAQDAYYRLMQMPWPALLGLFAGVFLTFNLLFAALYRLDPQGLVATQDMAHISLFWQDFFFSVHTVATIGYGNVYPASAYANIMVVVEITCGILYFALVTGIAFARFSRPTARILFSQVAVVHRADGVPVLMLRAANQRHNMLYAAQAQLAVLMDGEVGGIPLRRFVDLPLVRASNPVFPMTWLIMHRIDADSPLAGWLENGAPDPRSELVILVSGTDEVSGQVVHGRWAYNAQDIHWDARFADIVGMDPDGARTLDYTRFHQVEPCNLDKAETRPAD
jgi:inward rectifier potassium channel